jgi:hypothetical protein
MGIHRYVALISIFVVIVSCLTTRGSSGPLKAIAETSIEATVCVDGCGEDKSPVSEDAAALFLSATDHLPVRRVCILSPMGERNAFFTTYGPHHRGPPNPAS